MSAHEAAVEAALNAVCIHDRSWQACRCEKKARKQIAAIASSEAVRAALVQEACSCAGALRLELHEAGEHTAWCGSLSVDAILAALAPEATCHVCDSGPLDGNLAGHVCSEAT